METTLYYTIETPSSEKLKQTFHKITKDKYPKLFGYLHAKSKEIISQYKNHCEQPTVFGFPEFVLYEDAMNSLIKETGVKDRYVNIYMNGTTAEHKLCCIMGQGFFNDRIFKEQDPSMWMIKKIAKELEEEKYGKTNIPLYEQKPRQEIEPTIILTPTNWLKQQIKRDIDESNAKKADILAKGGQENQA